VKFGQREIGEVVRYLHDNKKKQNFAWLSRSHYCADRAKKSARARGGLNTVETRLEVFPIFGYSLASSRVTKYAAS